MRRDEAPRLAPLTGNGRGAFFSPDGEGGAPALRARPVPLAHPGGEGGCGCARATRASGAACSFRRRRRPRPRCFASTWRSASPTSLRCSPGRPAAQLASLAFGSLCSNSRSENEDDARKLALARGRPGCAPRRPAGAAHRGRGRLRGGRWWRAVRRLVRRSGQRRLRAAAGRIRAAARRAPRSTAPVTASDCAVPCRAHARPDCPARAPPRLASSVMDSIPSAVALTGRHLRP